MSMGAPQRGSTAGALIRCATMFQPFCRGSLPFLDAIGALVANLYNSTAIHSASYGGQFVDGLNNAEAQAKSIVVEDNDLRNWQFSTSDLLDSNHVFADLVLQCVCGAPSVEARAKQTKTVSRRKQPIRHSRDSLFWTVMARNEQYLTYAVVVATLQLFLHLTGANVTTLFLPMLSQTTGCRGKAAQIGKAVLVLVNTGGILGSALAMRQYGREVMCMISGVLIIFCQIAIPAIMEAHAGLGGGARMTTGYAAAMFALACAVSGGFSWSWGALFWAVPSQRIRSVGQVVGMALGFGLGFAQMQCFLLMLRQLKHAVFAYYAVWIWS